MADKKGTRTQEEKEKALKRFEATDLELDDKAKEGFARLKKLLDEKQAKREAEEAKKNKK